MQTTFEFILPMGYIDKDEKVHRKGIMRLATAKDEIEAKGDPRVKKNQDYSVIIVLSRVITNLEGLEAVTPEVIENLFIPDLNFLKDMYERINKMEESEIQVTCPHCGKEFTETIKR